MIPGLPQCVIFAIQGLAESFMSQQLSFTTLLIYITYSLYSWSVYTWLTISLHFVGNMKGYVEKWGKKLSNMYKYVKNVVVQTHMYAHLSSLFSIL